MKEFSISCIFLTVCILTHSFCDGQKIVETYVIPQDFRGKVNVVYKRPFGTDSKVINDTILYFVPKDGIAVAANNIKTTLEESNFIIIDSIGRTTKLPIHTPEQFFKSPDSLFYRNEVGVVINWTLGACSDDKSNFCYSDFYVGTNNKMFDYYTDELNERFRLSLLKKAKWTKSHKTK
jgi:hypothetical protein